MTLDTSGGVKAHELEAHGVPLKAGTAYRMRRAGLIPFVPVGAKLGGIRFNPADVLAALKLLAAKRGSEAPKDAA